MARSNVPRVKQEPGSLANTGVTRVLEVETMSDQLHREGRQLRSTAPSISTRPPPPSTIGYPEMEEDEEDECMIMEVKYNPKIEPGLEASHNTSIYHVTQSIQGSFIGANTALKDFGQPLKPINDALGELQARGIQHVANLPELVLVGDQSSGKSSLMSAIAGLSLPRSAGTCTRCPIHIRISRADEWSCRVFLNRDYGFSPPPHPITEQDVTAANRFPPWVKIDPGRSQSHRVEFKTVRDRFDAEEIETILLCAQVAILNPSTPHQVFVPKLGPDNRLAKPDILKRKEESSEAQFSPNTVALEIKGPELADLNFYDLPGVFNTARRQEDSYLERVVQNLTQEYVSRPKAIILWAVPMNLDTENSLALRIIRQAKAEDRCVGVITKADLLPREAAERWFEMLDGGGHHTGLGYFITSRQGHDLEEQTRREEAFFNRTADSTNEWPVCFDHFRDKCGIEKLKSFLSYKLGYEFSKVLPEVKQKVNSRLEAIRDQLSLYPDPPANPEMEIMRSLSEFSVRVKDMVTQQDFMSYWDQHYAEPFKQRILALKPKYNVQPPKGQSAARDPSPQDPIFIDSDQDDSPTPTPSRKRPAAAPPAHPRQRVKAEDAEGRIFPQTPAHNRLMVKPTGTPGSPRRGKPSKTLLDIRAMIQKNAIPGQPGLVSPAVYEPLFVDAAKSWKCHIDQFINHTLKYLEARIMQIMVTAFSKLKNRAVYKESLRHMNSFIEEQKKDLREKLFSIYQLESQRLFTKDSESLERYKTAEMRVLMRHRNYYRIAAHNGSTDINPPRKIEELTDEELAQETAKMAKDLRNLGPELFEQELMVAAYTRGYYLTAANRFTDYVCIHIMSGLLPRVATVIDTYLHDKLGLLGGGTTRELLDKLMEEEGEIGQKRRDLLAEKETLDGAMDIIINVENREQTPQQYNGINASQAESLQTDVATVRGHESPLSHRSRTYTATVLGDA
ncbi:hypothetical protein QBC35DRAFT_46463 [Podospora australis]|uniref:GED domain-containing protein n=1 Tax=Podospora australis TaxID=1536484 RepID=A0AAN6WMQ7_9PEZI|nr:hypothetical protein QBC35DRAFT_46463 [Podospora australis]